MPPTPQRARRCRGSTNPGVERLEARRLLTSLEGLLADATDAARFEAVPNEGPLQGAVEHRAPARDPDLTWLAARVDLPRARRLDRADATLQRLYSRALRGSGVRQTLRDLSLPGLQVRGGSLLVDVTVSDVAAALPGLRRIGFDAAATFDQGGWRLVAGYLPPERIEQALALPHTLRMQTALEPVRRSQGSVINAWEAVSGAQQFARFRGDITGAGVRVAILSDSFNSVSGGIAASQATGDLPPNAQLSRLNDGGGVDEGRAMAELVHDVAPGAHLILHAAGGSKTTLASAVTNVAVAGAHVTTDDIFYLDEPAFQDGPVNVAIDNAYLDHDVLHFSAAGNGNASNYLGVFSDADGDGLHEFAGADEMLTLVVPAVGSPRNSFAIGLQFDDPWGGAAADFDLEVYPIVGGVPGPKFLDSNTANIGGDPLDLVGGLLGAGTWGIAIRAVGGAAAGRRLFLYSNEQNNDLYTEHTTGMPGVYAHANAEFGFGIGAVPATSPGSIEPFSALGVVPIVFDDAGGRLASALTRANPAFVAADGVATTILPRFSPFFGTSAAAPNAAAIAALALDAAGDPGTFDWAAMRDLLRDTAVDLGATGYDTTFGYGRVNGLIAPYVALGRVGSAAAVELNPFGDAVVAGTLLANTDADLFSFASNSAGSASVTVAAGDPLAALAAVAWDASAEAFRAYGQSAAGGGLTLSLPVAPGGLRQVDVLGGADLAPALPAGFTATLDAPPQALLDLGLDLLGDATIQATLAAFTPVYYAFSAPANALGAATLRLEPLDAALDAVVSLYDASGALVARSDAAGAFAIEQISLSHGLLPGAAYFARVGSRGDAGAGAYRLTVNLTTLPGGLPLTWNDAGDGVLVPDRSGVFAGITPDPALAFAGQRRSYYFGLNSLNSGPLQFTLFAIADSPSPVRPAVVVYDAATGARVAHAGDSDDGLSGAATLVNVPATLGTRYIAVFADELGQNVGGLRVGGSVGALTAASVPIALDPAGDGSISLPSPPPALPAGGEVRFYRFVPPGGATGAGSVTVDAGDDDIEVWVMANESTVIGKARSAGAGAPEVVALSGLSPGSTYLVVVLPQSYAAPVQLGTIAIDLDAITGTARGVKYRDDDGDGARDPGEPGLSGFRIYFDENDNGALDPLERSVLTGPDGAYELTGLRIAQGPLGAVVREVPQAGYAQTAPASGKHTLFIPAGAPVVEDVDFGNRRLLDFGDAPDSYATLLAADGPRHWFAGGLTLGGRWDGEADGAPNPPATGDDTTGADDEDGVVFTGPIVPGAAASLNVIAPGGGVLDAWIDFNVDGAFGESLERIAAGLTLVAGTNTVSFTVPIGAPAGLTYARFRLTAGGVATPLGFGGEGEVEDHRVMLGAIVPPPPSRPDLTPGSDSGFDPNDNLTSDATPTFAGVAEPGALVRLFRDGALVASGVAGGSGSWTLTDAGPVPDGLHVYVATADLGAGPSDPSPPLDVVVDTTPPAVLFTGFEFDVAHAIETLFSEHVAPSLSVQDFAVAHAVLGPLPDAAKALLYDPLIEAATLLFPGSFSPAGAGTLPDGIYTLTLAAGAVADLAGNLTSATTVLDFFVLGADANRDEIVDVSDLGILATNWQQSGRVFSDGDFNYDGVVDVADLGILATQWQSALTAPVSAEIGGWEGTAARGRAAPFARRRVIDLAGI